ncbi:MAG: type transport system permease protein [Pseudonocardiales bacterium]|jgi:ABC-2 type transport system permease protein|nr:type transport system permease protein [Pseudonocardiales bacterium]MDT4931344.1 type transport system permease protein [Pseudonocardiales bacterium]
MSVVEHVSPTGVVGPTETDTTLRRVNAPQRFLHGFGPTAREIWAYRELLVNLARKELKIKYKDSVLGFVWSLLLPLVQLGVYWLVMGRFLGAGRSVPAYGVFIFCGLAVWSMFAEILSTSTTSIVYNSGLIKKVYFPRELFPLAATGAALVNFAFQFVILAAATTIAGIGTGKWPDPTNILYPVLAMVVMILFGTALGLMLAAANVYLRDTQHLITIVLMLWFWMTPIIYYISRVGSVLHGWLYDVYLLNPMVTVVLSFQRFFWPQGTGTQFEFTGNLYLRLIVLIAASSVLLWFAQRVFSRAQGNFAQEL